MAARPLPDKEAALARYLNTRRVPQDLADGRNVAPGQATSLTAKQQKEPHNKRLIDEGVLAPVKKEDGHAQTGH